MWWVRRKVTRRRQTSGDEIWEKSCHELDPDADVKEAPGSSVPTEVDSRVKRIELASPTIHLEKDGMNLPVELDGEWHGHEVADTSEQDEKDGGERLRSSSIVETPTHFLAPPLKF